MRKITSLLCVALAIGAGGLALAPMPADAQSGVTAPRTSSSVFYEHNESELGAQAIAILDNVAAKYASERVVALRIVGHADGAEAKRLGAENAHWLSQRRAGNVRLYLGSRGVPDGAMLAEAYGAQRPAKQSLAGIPPMSRRVEIEFLTATDEQAK